jgi:hypothetical protein
VKDEDACEVRFTAHAYDVMIERDLDPAWVIEAVLRPDRVEADPKASGLRRAYRSLDQLNGRALRVVYAEEGGLRRVVTVFPDRAARRKR